MAIEFSYKPIKPQDGKITVRDYAEYVDNRDTPNIVKAFAISPLEEAMKKQRKKEWDFGFKVSKKIQEKKTTSWERIHNSLLKFLEIRADDSRAYNMEGLELFEGLGYCISTKDLKDYINKQIENATSESEYPQLFWPRAKKNEEFPTTIILPRRDYSQITDDNAKLILQAKRFNSGLEKEVFDEFKEANKLWFTQKTGYSLENLPSKIQGFVQEYKILDNGKPILVNLVRQEKPQYKEIIETLQAELADLENGVFIEGYKSRQTKQGTYINIKNIFDRLSEERLEKDNLIKIEGRYEIFP